MGDGAGGRGGGAGGRGGDPLGPGTPPGGPRWWVLGGGGGCLLNWVGRGRRAKYQFVFSDVPFHVSRLDSLLFQNL